MQTSIISRSSVVPKPFPCNATQFILLAPWSGIYVRVHGSESEYLHCIFNKVIDISQSGLRVSFDFLHGCLLQNLTAPEFGHDQYMNRSEPGIGALGR